MAESREALILEMRAENELDPAVKKAVRSIDQFGVTAEESATMVEKALGRAQAKFGSFAKASSDAAAQVEDNWKLSLKSVNQLADQIVKSGAGAGQIDVGVQKSQEALGVSRQRLAVLQQLEAAEIRNAGAETQTNAAIQQKVAAYRTAIAQEQARIAELGAEVGALERLQIELRAAGFAEETFGAKQKAVATTSGQARAGMQQLSFQLNDVALGFAAGTPPMIIFAQQSSQVIQAIGLMAGESKGLLGILAGPWGMAFTAALVVLTPFVGKLLEGTTAAEENAKALADVHAASNGLSDAQSVLGTMFDLTTGKIKAQNEMLRLNAQILAIKLRAEASAAEASSGRTFSSARSGKESLFDFSDGLIESGPHWTARIRRAQRLRGVSQALDAGILDPVTASKWAEKFDFTGLKVTRAEFLEALTSRLTAQGNRKTAGMIEDSLTRGELNAGLLQEKPDKKKKGPSAETLARRAEAARLKLLDQDTAYGEAERQARHKLLDAIGKTSTSEEQRDQLLRDDINAEAEQQKRKIANQLASGDITDTQAKKLQALNEEARAQRLFNVNIMRAAATVRRAADLKVEDLDQQLAMAQIEADLATTARERRAVEHRILDLQLERERQIQQAIIDNPESTPDERARAGRAIAAAQATHDAAGQQVDQRNATPIEQYRQRLQQSAGDMNSAMEQVQVNGLQSLEDGLAGIITGTESVASAFKKMANQIIADLIRIAIQKVILNAISGGTLGFLGFSKGGEVQGHADGGAIFGAGTGTSDSIPAWLSNGEFVMRAEAVRRIGVPALNALNSGSLPGFAAGGLVSPRLPSMGAAGTRGRVVYEQHFHVNARGAVLAEGLVTEMRMIGVRAALGGAEMAQTQASENAMTALS